MHKMETKCDVCGLWDSKTKNAVGSRKVHDSCMVCVVCNQGLKGEYLLTKDAAYHENCHPTYKKQCAMCHKPMDLRVRTMGDVTFCVDHTVECIHCNLPITQVCNSFKVGIFLNGRKRESKAASLTGFSSFGKSYLIPFLFSRIKARRLPPTVEGEVW